MELHHTLKWSSLIGWAVIIGGEGIWLLFSYGTGNFNPQNIFLALSFAALGLWTFRLVHPLVPGIFLLVGFMGFGLNSPNIILSGFATPLFFLGLCGVIIGGYLIDSRLYRRFIEWSLRFLPPGPFWMFFGVYLTGLFMTLTLPSFHSRLQVAQDMCRQWASYLGIRPSSSQINFFLISFHQSIFIFSPIFLTGSLYNLIVLGFFHPHDQERFSWLAWFSYSFVPFSVLGIGILIFLGIVSYQGTLNIHRDSSLKHIAREGRMRLPEKVVLLAAGVFIGGFLTSPFHEISSAVWAGVVLLYFLINGSFSFTRIQGKLEWTDLLLLGCLGSIATLAASLNILGRLENISLLSQGASSYQTLFLIGLTVGISLARTFLPYRTVIMLGSFFLIPFAYTTNFHVWVAAFILLTSASSSWKIKEGMGIGRLLEVCYLPDAKDKKQIWRWLVYFNCLRMLSILAALTYWQSQGLL